MSTVYFDVSQRPVPSGTPDRAPSLTAALSCAVLCESVVIVIVFMMVDLREANPVHCFAYSLT